MRSSHVSLLGGVPGVLLAIAAVAGWCPGARDLPTYFVPLRERVAEVIERSHSPFWNSDAGCGEPFFANPQTGVLYPPAWLATLLPGRQAIGVEVGLHLALLGAGSALLALRLGATGWLAVAAGWGVALSGPAASAAGVLNNLDTLAWVPFLWCAALAGSTGGVAVFLALAYLGGEPQLAFLAAAVAIVLAPRRRILGGVALGVGLVAVQLVPFVVWAAVGDRGVGSDLAEVIAGAVAPREVPAILVASVPLPPRADRFVGALAIPAWGALLAVWALLERGAVGRRLAACGWALAGASVLAGVGWSGRVWAAATLGLVRYPGRLLFLAVVALLPAAAAVAAKGRGRVAVGALGAGAVAAIGVAAGAGWVALLVQAAAAALVLIGGPLGGAAALAAAGALAVHHLPVLQLAKNPTNPVPACLIAQRAPGRVFAVQPSVEQVAAVARAGEQRAFDLGWGYTALLDGRTMARTFAPLRPRAAGRPPRRGRPRAGRALVARHAGGVASRGAPSGVRPPRSVPRRAGPCPRQPGRLAGDERRRRAAAPRRAPARTRRRRGGRRPWRRAAVAGERRERRRRAAVAGDPRPGVEVRGRRGAGCRAAGRGYRPGRAGAGGRSPRRGAVPSPRGGRGSDRLADVRGGAAGGGMAAFVTFLFVLSGMVALVYQVAWVRALGLLVGSSLWASVVVVGAYMGGMALGSAAVARFAGRIRAHLRLYAAAEALAAMAALATAPVLAALAGPAAQLGAEPLAGWGLPLAGRFLLAWAFLAVPTVAMGATLPLLVERVGSEPRLSRRVVHAVRRQHRRRRCGRGPGGRLSACRCSESRGP